MQIKPHIKIIKTEDGQTLIEIEDWELFNHITEYLTEEYDIEYDSYIPNKNITPHVYTALFSKDCNHSNIKDALNKLDEKDIFRIFKINN